MSDTKIDTHAKTLEDIDRVRARLINDPDLAQSGTLYKFQVAHAIDLVSSIRQVWLARADLIAPDDRIDNALITLNNALVDTMGGDYRIELQF